VPMLRQTDRLSIAQPALIGEKARILREERGWKLRRLAKLMDWDVSVACRAEGGSADRQRRFTLDEVKRLAAIFGVPISYFLEVCTHCGGQPPHGFACLVCEAASPMPHALTRQDSRAEREPV
jgi:transcriptional regulator with XRE-family HTH domain